jgi:SAM-dependent methyltransferase
MQAADFASKTYSPADLSRHDVADAASRLRRFALRCWLRGEAIAINGFLRWRFWIRQAKLWEYARGVAFLEAVGARRVLDFGGGATPPVLYLAARGCEVLSLDIEPRLAEATTQFGRRHGWALRGSAHNLVNAPLAASLAGELPFDAAMSFSVFEHIPEPAQMIAMRRFGELLRPGGFVAMTIDFGADAPAEFAARDAAHIERLIAASGLEPVSGAFRDTGERFPIDRRQPEKHFTFASLFLRKPE